MPTPGRFRVGLDSTPAALVGMASFDNSERAYPADQAEVTTLVDCGGDRLIIEWTLPGPLGEVRACDLMQLQDGKVYRVRTYYGLRSAEIVEGVQGL